MQELWTRKRGRLVQARAQASDRKRTDKNTMGFLHSNGSSNRPDYVVLEKTSRKCLLIDIACPFDTRVANKEKEKIEKYQDLRRELQRIWKCSDVKIIPVVIGTLGTLPKCLPKWLRVLNMTCDIELLQKVCLLGSARILRRVLDM